MQTYRVPDGYQLDPQSGFYYRETQIPGPDGQMVKHVVWFNAETGAYSQQSYYLPQPTTPTSDPWADARHGGGGYSPKPPPPPPPPKPPIIKKIVIPIVTVIFVVGVGVAGVKLLPPLIGGGNEPASTVQSDESKPAGGGLFGGSDKVEEGEIGNTMMNLQNGGLMAYHNGWVYYADATKGGALYARKEGQDAEKAVLIAPGQICNINVLGDELVYTYSGGDGVTRLSVNGEAIRYDSWIVPDSVGGYCPVAYWPGDYNVGDITKESHIIQIYAGMAYKITGVKAFEKSGGGLSKPILLGEDEQRYIDLTLTKDGVFAIKGEAGVPFDDMTSGVYVKLTEGQETELFEVPCKNGVRRACWSGGKLYLDARESIEEGNIFCYNPKDGSLTDLGSGFFLTAWNNSLYCISGDQKTIGEIKPGSTAIETVYSTDEKMEALVNNADGHLGVIMLNYETYLLLQQQGDTLTLAETVAVNGLQNPYLISSTTFELGKKTHTYFERYGAGIIPY